MDGRIVFEEFWSRLQGPLLRSLADLKSHFDFGMQENDPHLEAAISLLTKNFEGSDEAPNRDSEDDLRVEFKDLKAGSLNVKTSLAKAWQAGSVANSGDEVDSEGSDDDASSTSSPMSSPMNSPMSGPASTPESSALSSLPPAPPRGHDVFGRAESSAEAAEAEVGAAEHGKPFARRSSAMLGLPRIAEASEQPPPPPPRGAAAPAEHSRSGEQTSAEQAGHAVANPLLSGVRIQARAAHSGGAHAHPAEGLLAKPSASPSASPLTKEQARMRQLAFQARGGNRGSRADLRSGIETASGRILKAPSGSGRLVVCIGQYGSIEDYFAKKGGTAF